MKISISSAVIFIGGLLALGAAAAIGQPAWDFAPFVPGSGRVSVLIDTNSLERNALLEEAGIDVHFFDAAGTAISTQHFELLLGRPPLQAGRVYQIDLNHGYGAATRVDADTLTYMYHAGGANADTPVLRAVRGVSRRPGVQVDPPAGKRSDLTTKRCNAYADLAKAAQAINRDRRCGFPASNVWNDNFALHYNWCLSVSSAEVESATLVRSRMLLEQCGR